MRSIDLKDMKTYNPKDVNDKQLGDDFRLMLALWCNKKANKKVKSSWEDILNILRMIIIESTKRGNRTFHPLRMKACSREAFKKAIKKDFPKDIKVPIATDDYEGLYLEDPHAKLLSTGKKKSVLFDKIVSIDQPFNFLDNKNIYGIVKLINLRRITRKAALKDQKEHLTTKKDLDKWWPNIGNLYIADVEDLKLWDKPITIDMEINTLFVDFAELYPVLKKIKKLSFDTMEVKPSGETSGDEIVLADILQYFDKPIMDKEDFLTLTGGIVNQGKTKNDFDILIKKKVPTDNQDDVGFKFRIGRGMPNKLSDRLHWSYDTFRGPFTNHLHLFNRWLIPASVPTDAIEKLCSEYSQKLVIHKMSAESKLSTDELIKVHEKLHEGGK